MSGRKSPGDPDFRSIVELLEDGFAIVRRGKTLYRSPIWAARLGESAQGEEGRSYFEFIVPEDRARVQELYRKKVQEYDNQDPAGVEPLQFEVTLESESGERITADVKTHLLQHDGGPATLLVLRDISRQRQVERALRISEERYRLVSELTSDFAYAMRLNEKGELRTEWVTGAYSRITGYTVGEIWDLGGWEKLLHPEDMPRARNFIRQALGGRDLVGEFRFVTKQGQTRWIRTYTRPLLDKDRGRAVGVLGACQDITASKEAEQALAQRNAQLTKANRLLEELHRSKDQVTAIISHELRTPLVTGLGYLELILDGTLGPVPSKISRRLHKALGSLRRLQQLIDGLLQYNRFLNTDLFESRAPAPIDIARLAREAVTDFLIRTRIPEERMVLHVPDVPVWVRASPDPMRIVLENLLNNAALHAGERARIDLRVLHASDVDIRVEVSDDGVGMPEELVTRAWNLFVKSKESTEGLGLGLAIVQAILKSHQTEPHLESGPGLGTTVWFRLPAAEAA